MTDDLLNEEDRRLLMFSVSSDGDLRGWAFNPENVRGNCIYSKLSVRASSSYSSLAGPIWVAGSFVFGLGSIVVFVCSLAEGHTTAFYLGKTDLPRASSSKISRGKFFSFFFFYLGKKFWEGHTTDIGSECFHAQLNFLECKFKKARCTDLADQRDVFFFCLAVISHANSTCMVKTGVDVDDSCPQNFLHRVSYVRFCRQDLRL